MNRIVVWDLETTGLNPFHDQIIEIAAVDNQGNSFESLVRLEEFKTLSAKVKEITGITEDMLKDKPSISDTLDKFLKFISGATYLVGHNSMRFDYLFLKTAMRKYKNTDALSLGQIDTMLIYQYYYPTINSFALGSLCKCFSIPQRNAHRAMGDVKATYDLFERILKIRKVEARKLFDICN
jgi:DNA polymerase-3 subunit alpha (Gram-positive type)